MPATRAVLADITKYGLDPAKPHYAGKKHLKVSANVKKEKSSEKVLSKKHEARQELETVVQEIVDKSQTTPAVPVDVSVIVEDENFNSVSESLAETSMTPEVVNVELEQEKVEEVNETPQLFQTQKKRAKKNLILC